jgi:ActR/RegA family two-component response regulator
MGREALKLGAYDYITKPLDFDYLERVLWVKIMMMTL